MNEPKTILEQAKEVLKAYRLYQGGDACPSRAHRQYREFEEAARTFAPAAAEVIPKLVTALDHCRIVLAGIPCRNSTEKELVQEVFERAGKALSTLNQKQQ